MFQAEIVLVEPTGPENDGGLPSYRLPGEPTRGQAVQAAYAELARLKRPVGSAYFHPFDANGHPV